jgi:hypothetical protein
MPVARLPLLAASALALASACTPVALPAAPLDRFHYPTGLALAGGHLLVVSSNFDLSYEDDVGGSVLSVDPQAWLDGSPGFAGGLNIPSFGGPMLVADATACQLDQTEALVASRLSGELYRIRVASDGGLSCGDGCAVPLADPGEGDPMAVAVSCVADRPKRAFVGWRRGRLGTQCDPSALSSDVCAIVSEVRLDVPGSRVNTGPILYNGGTIQALHYDATTDLLFFATTGSRVGWVDLSSGCVLGSRTSECTKQSLDLSIVARGAAARNVTLSTPVDGRPRRLYALVRLLDPTSAAAGIEVQLGGALIVLELEASSTGSLGAQVVRTVPLTTGVSDVLVLPPRAGRRDLLAITAVDDGEIWFYDDEVGAVTGVIGRGPDGVPVVGRGPFALAAEERPGAGVRLYVTAFNDSVVTVLDLTDLDDPDPLTDPPGVAVVGRIGG